jgi:hypothetical protein
MFTISNGDCRGLRVVLPSDKLRLLDPLDVQVPGNGLGFTDVSESVARHQSGNQA